MARVVVVGGDAAGMTAAAALRRRLPREHEVVVLERGEWTSYSACGIPYWVAGEVGDAEDLVARSPAEHLEHGIDLRMGVEAVALDVDARTVTTDAGERITYDALVLAMGAEPVRPDLPGIHGEGILGVQSLGDGQRVIEALETRPEHVVVVGSGYIGLEMAEAFVIRGIATAVIERSPLPLSMLEPPLAQKVATAMRGRGIELHTETEVSGFELDAAGHVRGVRVRSGDEGDDVVPADLVVLGLGVRARSALASAAGLPTGVKGGIVTDVRQRVAGFDGVWAAGDCVETRDRTTGLPLHLPLGTHANKQGMVVADDVAATLLGVAPRLTFPGVVQTAITKFCALEISRTGLGEQQARDAGHDPAVVSIQTSDRAGYMPDAGELTVLMVADRATRRLLGVQVVGTENAGLRVDAAATAITAEMTVDDVVMLDLAYAPPFASVWSPIQVAARAAVRALDA